MKHSQGRAFHLLIMLLVSTAIGSAGLSWLLFNSSLFNPPADTRPSPLEPINTPDALRIPSLEDLRAADANPMLRQNQATMDSQPDTPSTPAALETAPTTEPTTRPDTAPTAMPIAAATPEPPANTPNLISLSMLEQAELPLEEDIPSPDETMDGLLDPDQDADPPMLPGQATMLDKQPDSSSGAAELPPSASNTALDSPPDSPIADTSGATALPVSPDDETIITELPETALATPAAEPPATAVETPAADDETAPPDPRDVVIIEPESAATTPTAANGSEPLPDTGTAAHSGWIYAGQFQNGRWVQSGIRIAPDQLPQTGARYELLWGTTIRSGPPSRRTDENGSNLGQNIGYLQDGTQVDILTVKPSGTQGHYWLEIRYN
ncbi:MAG: hypothetical protein KDI44_16605 [Thiothrix sp.]|nr:hypothetical protein [Thiothrix sp.]HPQ94369.1 hypothetical protein [Thiolinea sp.]